MNQTLEKNVFSLEEPEVSVSIPNRSANQVFGRMEELLAECKYLDCYGLGVQAFGSNVSHWPTLTGQRFAISTANRLGGWQLGKVLAYRVTRMSPESAEARYYRFSRAMDKRPLSEVWLEYRNQELDVNFPRLQAAWLQLKAGICGAFRDFSSAHSLLEEAGHISPNNPSVQLHRISLLLQEDRTDEALQLNTQLYKSLPLCSVVASGLASIMTQANQVDEAVELLESHMPITQYGGVATQLVALYTQRGQYDKSVQLLRGIEQYFPLADPLRQGLPKPGSFHADIASERSEVLYHLGKLKLCVKEARRVRRPYYDRLADHLQTFTDEPKRKELKIPFQRQDHMTCAPATLSMLAGYWKVSVDHDEIANDICYEGTSAVDQRLWAEANGFVAREFRCTQDATQQLIDAEIPFALTTIEPDSAHIQVICGYDRQRGTVLIQDPSSWFVAKGQFAELLENYQWCGPRALVLVPKEKAHLLENVDLPDVEQYEWLYHMEIALRAHNSSSAERMLSKFQAWDAEHRLTYWGSWLVACHENNAANRLAALTALCEQYPKSEALFVRMADELIRLGKTDHSIQMLRGRIDSREAGLASHLQLISLLGDDCSEEMQCLLRKVLTWAPSHESALLRSAYHKEQTGEFENGFELLRLASCASPASGNVMGRLLHASERFGRSNEVIEILRERFDEFGHLNSDPGLLYARALSVNLQIEEAAKVLREAVAKRPEDGELICQAAMQIGFLEDAPAGRKLLETAKVPLPEISHHQTLAQLAEVEGRLEEALELWHQSIILGADACLCTQPITRLTSEVEGVPATIRYLTELAERNPDNVSVLSETASWLIQVGELERGLEFIDQVLHADSSHGWAWRERALLFLEWNQPEQALEDASKALQCEQNVYSYQIRADVYVALGQAQEAKQDYQAGLALNVDSPHAIRRWLSICDSDEERREVVRFLMKELATQSINGDGLRTFFDEARWILDTEAMEQSLLFLRKRWPNMLQILNLLSEFLQDHRRYKEAIAAMRAEEERFGMLADYWSELGVALIEDKQLEQAIEAYHRAFHLDPNSVEVAERLVYALTQVEKLDESREILERALAGNPNDARLLLSFAKLSESEESMIRMASKAAFNAPRWDAPWAYLEEIEGSGDATLRLEVTAELLERNQRDVPALVRRAEAFASMGQETDCRETVEQALEFDATYLPAYQAMAASLARADQMDAALEACQPVGLPAQDAMELQCYGAELLFAYDRQSEACRWLYDAIREDCTVPAHWSRLADMAEVAGEGALFCEAADMLYSIAPDSEVALGYRFAKLQMQESWEEAEECLRAAIQINPSYEYGVFQLFLILSEAERWDEAEQLIENSTGRVSEVLVWETSILIAVSRRRSNRIEQLLREPPNEHECFNAILRCDSRFSEEERERVLKLAQEELQLGRASRLMANCWAALAMNSYGPTGTFELLLKIRNSRGWLEALRFGWNALDGVDFSELPTSAQLFDCIEKIIKTRTADIVRSDKCWAGAIWTSLMLGRYDLATLLAKRFAEVPNPYSDSLSACLAAFTLRIDLKSAQTVIDFAEANHQTQHPDFIAFRVICAALQNDFQSVTRYLMQIDRGSVQTGCQAMLEMISLALEAQDTGSLASLERFFADNFEQPQNYESTLFHVLCRQVGRKHNRPMQVISNDLQRLQLWWGRK